MRFNGRYNVMFSGAKNRSSLLDVIYPEKDARLPLIIFAHGFKGYKDWGQFPLLTSALAEAGFAVLKFNFSHNGGTVQNPIDFPDLEAFAENNYYLEQEDLNAILNWTFEKQEEFENAWDINQIYLIGHSRGGSMALVKAANDKRVKKVVSWAAVSNLLKRLPERDELKSWKTEGVRYIENGRTKQSMPMHYQFVENLYQHSELLNVESACRKMIIPQLIIHGEQDEAVSLSMAKELKAWNPKAQLEIIKNTGHTFGGKQPWLEEKLPLASQQLLEKTIAFLNA